MRKNIVLFLKLSGFAVIPILILSVTGLFSGASITEETSWRQSSEVLVPKPIEVVAESNPKTIGLRSELEISVFGRLKNSQYIYSGKAQGELGPIPTSIELDHPLFSKVGPVTESETTQIADQTFDRFLNIHRKEFHIKQRFRVERLPDVDAGKLTISGYLLYQQCTDRICSLPTKSNFDLVLTISH